MRRNRRDQRRDIRLERQNLDRFPELRQLHGGDDEDEEDNEEDSEDDSEDSEQGEEGEPQQQSEKPETLSQMNLDVKGQNTTYHLCPQPVS